MALVKKLSDFQSALERLNEAYTKTVEYREKEESNTSIDISYY